MRLSEDIELLRFAVFHTYLYNPTQIYKFIRTFGNADDSEWHCSFQKLF